MVDVAVITRLPEVPVHVEFFSSPEAVVEEKASLIKALKPDGVLVLYAGDYEIEKLKSRTKGRVITFGLTPEAEVRAEDVSLLFESGNVEQWPIGMKARLVMNGIVAPIEVVGSAGAHALLPALGGAAVGAALNKKVEEIIKALESYDPPPGRMRLLRGIKNSLLIDDSYNSSPAATVAALDALNLIGSHTQSRKVAVLGDMLELGKHSAAEHKKVGAHAAKTCNLLVTIGFRSRDIAEGAEDNGMPDDAILQYEHGRKAARELKNLLRPNDVLLVKGSQSMRLERVVEELMEEPEKAHKLLVRQDKEWKDR
jgi:UDP-N-acetylmuramoyl-tripeptide--D-alanyl-D-alanine ligase